MTHTSDTARLIAWLAITAVILATAVAADLQGWFA